MTRPFEILAAFALTFGLLDWATGTTANFVHDSLPMLLEVDR